MKKKYNITRRKASSRLSVSYRISISSSPVRFFFSHPFSGLNEVDVEKKMPGPVTMIKEHRLIGGTASNMVGRRGLDYK